MVLFEYADLNIGEVKGNMKRLISIVLTLFVLLGLNYVIASITNTRFIDCSFVVGLVLSTIIWFFSSKGGLTSRLSDGMIQAQTANFKLKGDDYKFSPNIVFFTALVYTFFSIVFTFIYYRSYFLN